MGALRTKLTRRALLAAVACALLVIAIWGAQALWAPTLLVGSSPGLQTALQALPATFVALLALGFGAVFVVVQQAASTLTTRSGTLLLRDGRVVVLVLLTLGLTAAALLLSGQIPDQGANSCHAVTAAVGTLMIAAAALVIGYAVVIPGVVSDHTLPFTVVDRLLAGVKEVIHKEAPDDWLASLGEVERNALNRHDEGTYRKCMVGVADLLQRDETIKSDRKVGAPLARHIAGAAEAAVATDGPLFEAAVLRALLPACAEACVRSTLDETAQRLVVSYARLGTRIDRPERATNLAEVAESLAAFTSLARECEHDGPAETGLALWATVFAVACVVDTESADSIAMTRGLLGDAPPYTEAAKLVGGAGWAKQWPNAERDKALEALQPPTG